MLTVSKLIEKLQKMPLDAEVGILYDGEIRRRANCAYVSKSGQVVIADVGEVIYSDQARPVEAPTEKEVKFFYTRKDNTTLKPGKTPILDFIKKHGTKTVVKKDRFGSYEAPDSTTEKKKE